MDYEFLFYAAIAVIIGICYLGAHLWRRSRKRKTEGAFLHRYPNAVKLYFHTKDKRQSLDVPKVDGESPVKFKDKKDRGIYLVPGEMRKLNLLCEVAIPRTNTKTIHTAVQELMPEPQKTYKLEFDEEINGFLLN